MTALEPQRVGVVVQRRNYFGAMLVHLPVIHALRTAWPNAELVAFSDVKAGGVLARIGAVDRLIPFQPNPWVSRGIFKQADCQLVVVLRPSALSVLLALATIPGVRTAVHRHGINWLFANVTAPLHTGIYRAVHYGNLAAALGIAVPSTSSAMAALANDSLLELPEGDGPLVALIPGAGGRRKMWPLDRYLTVVRRLRADRPGLRLVVVLGGDETDLAKAVPSEPWIRVSIHADVPALAALALRADLVLSNDCGPGHVFQMAGTPGVHLFANYKNRADELVAEWWLPRPGAVAMHPDRRADVAVIPVDRVTELAQACLDDPQHEPRVIRHAVATGAGF